MALLDLPVTATPPKAANLINVFVYFRRLLGARKSPQEYLAAEQRRADARRAVDRLL